MRKPRLQLLLLCLFVSISQLLWSQTSWKGISSTSWRDAANWTNGIPTASVDAIIGDANFIGTFQPNLGSSGSCKSLTLGGTKTVTFSVNKNLTVTGNFLINSNATTNLGKATLTVNGSWTNNGTFTVNHNNSSVIFGGTSQTIGGTSVTTFRKLTINAGSNLTLNKNIVVSGGNLIVNGTINPNESPTYTVTAANINVGATGTLKVNAANIEGNYNTSNSSLPAITLSTGSIVDYSSKTSNQEVNSSLSYSTLKISGTTTKSLTNNLPALKSASSSDGNILVAEGIFDLSTYSANRGNSVAGGTLKVLGNATIKIGGTGTLPSNYATNTFALTSTVEYNGTNQTVSAQSYGNLILSSSGGGVTKTMPTSAFIVQGDLTSSAGLGTGVSFTAASNITVNGNFTIGSSTTFNSGNSFTHAFAGNLINNGVLAGNASTINMTGPGASISGTGDYTFHNLNIAASRITAAANTILNVTGNFSTSGEGIFTHSPTGKLVMTGTGKSISGANITLHDLSINGGVNTTSSFLVTGDLSVNGSFTGTSGTVTMNGASKTISGEGSISFSELSAPGSITTTSSFSISSALDVSGSFVASAGTATFKGNSALNGTVYLYNANLNGTALKLSTNAQLGIAGNFTITSGSLDVTTSIPNTVVFNGTSAQTIPASAFHHLVLATGGTKTAGGAITTNGNFTINPSVTFEANSYLHTLYGNFINNGSFTALNSTIRFSGAQDASITGTTAFDILEINKTSAANVISLLNDINAVTVHMTSGTINTGTRTLTITLNRSGNGIIIGTIKRQHTFETGVDYEFESPYNKLRFNEVPQDITSITQSIKLGVISDYPYVSAINREYTISGLTGTYKANLYLHYEDSEVGGNDEAIMQLWKNDGIGWSATNKSGNDVTSNFVYLDNVSDLNQRWTLASLNNVLQWNGSVDSDWNTPGNWNVIQGAPGSLPGANDVVQIGNANFTHHPTISKNITVKNIEFGSVKPATLTIATGGSLTTGGNIRGSWSADAVHTINVGAQNLTIQGDLVLSDGITNHAINLNVSNGNLTVGGSLTHSGNANLVYSGTGSLSIAGNYYYSSGTFTAGNSTVIYNGTQSQAVAGIVYNHLNINKTSGTASISNATTINGNCTITSGTLSVSGTTQVAGSVAINSAATFSAGSATISVMGNWSNSGTFVPGSSTVFLNGTGSQSVSSTTFNKLTIAKSSGTASLTGNTSVNGDISVTAGTLDLASYSANRTSLGGTFAASSGTTILLSGSNNWPSSYSTYTLSPTSTVHYNGVVAQTIGGITYGNLIMSNGASNAKTLGAMITVAGDLNINSGAALNASAYNIALGGNWTNNGNFIPSTGTVLLNGNAKVISGNTTFNRVVVYGKYSVSGSDITYNNLLNVTSSGSFEAGSGTAILNGDLINSGSLTSSGITTFSGTQNQTIRLLNALVSTSSGIVNFNGSVSPVLNSTSTPTFANLNINNTAGIYPSISWLIGGNLTIATGASFHGGFATHTVKGNFTNNGSVTSSGTLNFDADNAATIALGNDFKSTGKVIFGGTGQLTITGVPATFTDVVIANSNRVQPSASWLIGRSFTINSNAIFNAGANTYTVAGDLESNGTLDGGSSTFVLTSTPSGNLTTSAYTNFYDLSITGSIIANTDVNVTRNFTNNGTFDASIAALIMTGSINSIIGGTTTPLVLDQMINTKEASAITTLAVDLSGVSNFEVRSGTFNTATYTITKDVGEGILKIFDLATLKIEGTNSLPSFNTYTFSPLSTVLYAGTTQSILATPVYGHLVVSTSGTATPSGALTITNNFTLNSGTFAAGNYTHMIGSNWTMTAGTFNNTGSTILFNGISDQQISSTGAFNNVTINKASGFTKLSSQIAVNGTLTFVSGLVTLNNFDLNMGTAATIAGYADNRYFIANGQGSLKQYIAGNGSKIFPVGTNNAYIPATVSLSSGSTADNFRVRVMDAPYTNGTTGTIVTSNAVNATWLISEDVTGGSDATVSLQWPQALELSGFSRTACRLAHFTSGNWEYGSNNIVASGSGPYTATRAGFKSFSPFIVSSSMDIALPVTWTAVYGKNEGVNNHIYWSTASEYNNNYFVVEASSNGQHFAEIGRVRSNGNASSVQNYDYLHRNVTSTVTRYRIKQVDIDGKYEYSQIIQVIASSGFNVFLPSGNIFTNSIQMSVQVPGNTTGQLTVSDASGKVIIQKEYKLFTGGNPFNLDMQKFAAGVYFFKIQTTDGFKEVLKFVKR